MKKLSCSAPGKIIIAGEHSVVYGYPSIVSAIDMRTKIDFTPVTRIEYELKLNNKNIIINSNDMDQFLDKTTREFPIFNRILDLIEEKHEGSLKILDRNGFHVEITSSIPIGAGLGSSATICACLCKIFLEQFGIKMPEGDFLELSKNAEKFYHSKSSGVDTTAAIKGGAFLFQEGKIIDKITSILKLDGDLLVVNTGIPRNTGKMVSGLKDLYNDKQEPVVARFEAISEIVNSIWKLFKSGNVSVKSLGSLLLNNQEELAALELSINAIEKIIETSMNNGAEGGKLTGAGGGGCVLVTCLKENSNSVINALQKEGFEANIVILDDKGIILDEK